MKKKIEFFENDKNKIICYFSDKSTKTFSKSYDNTLKLLIEMEEQHLDIREEMIDKVRKLDKYQFLLSRLSIGFGVLTIIKLLLIIVFPNIIPILLVIISSTSVLDLILFFTSLSMDVYFKNKADKIFDDLDSKDFVLNNSDVLNSDKSFELIKSINTKLFEVMKSNKYRLIPSLNINTARYLSQDDIKALENELEIESSYIEDEEEPEKKYDTKIIKFKKM